MIEAQLIDAESVEAWDMQKQRKCLAILGRERRQMTPEHSARFTVLCAAFRERMREIMPAT